MIPLLNVSVCVNIHNFGPMISDNWIKSLWHLFVNITEVIMSVVEDHVKIKFSKPFGTFLCEICSKTCHSLTDLEKHMFIDVILWIWRMNFIKMNAIVTIICVNSEHTVLCSMLSALPTYSSQLIDSLLSP